jgi:hypothetical protein
MLSAVSRLVRGISALQQKQTFGGATNSSIDWPAGNDRLTTNSDTDLINNILMEASIRFRSE